MNPKTRNLTWILSALLVIIVVGGYLFWKNNIGTINVPSTKEGEDTEELVENLSGFSVPPGFSLSVFAKDLPGARVMAIAPNGGLVVSQTDDGKITLLTDDDGDGTRDIQKVLKSGLNKPHGLAFDCREECFLYVAQKDKLTRFPYDREAATLGDEKSLMEIAGSPTDRHFTRSLVFLPSPNEDILLVSVGSSCDVCHEENPDYASVISYNIKTGEKAPYAKGLRNATFMTLDPVSGRVFATEMGRDALGDEIPPDEINIIEKGKNYGWPICYGNNIHDTKFDKNTYIRNPCMEPFETPSFVDLQAHSAPLGLAFIPEEGWPEEWWYDLLVAYHGSWNRTVPTGYKIARIKLDAKGVYSGTEDFITGWLTDSGEKTGRPADILVLSGGTAYISDDTAGVIYKLKRTAE